MKSRILISAVVLFGMAAGAEAQSIRDQYGSKAEACEVTDGNDYRDTEGYLKATLQRYPDFEQAEEFRTWIGELGNHAAEDAWKATRFYDSRQRTRHATRSAYERFVAEYPESPHVGEARARIAELADPDPAAGKAN